MVNEVEKGSGLEGKRKRREKKLNHVARVAGIGK
jgi:hypothetical protein